jgi:hypothetical protein
LSSKANPDPPQTGGLESTASSWFPGYKKTLLFRGPPAVFNSIKETVRNPLVVWKFMKKNPSYIISTISSALIIYLGNRGGPLANQTGLAFLAKSLNSLLYNFGTQTLYYILYDTFVHLTPPIMEDEEEQKRCIKDFLMYASVARALLWFTGYWTGDIIYAGLCMRGIYDWLDERLGERNPVKRKPLYSGNY